MTKITIYDHETGETVEREMTVAEQTNYDNVQTEIEAELEAQAAKATARTALLAKLGITEAEAQLLLG